MYTGIAIDSGFFCPDGQGSFTLAKLPPSWRESKVSKLYEGEFETLVKDFTFTGSDGSGTFQISHRRDGAIWAKADVYDGFIHWNLQVQTENSGPEIFVRIKILLDNLPGRFGEEWQSIQADVFPSIENLLRFSRDFKRVLPCKSPEVNRRQVEMVEDEQVRRIFDKRGIIR